MNNQNSVNLLEVVKLFVENGQNINAVGRDGISMLIRCVLYKQTKSVEYLLDNPQIDLEIKSKGRFGSGSLLVKAGETALDVAKRKKMTGIVEIFQKVIIFSQIRRLPIFKNIGS